MRLENEKARTYDLAEAVQQGWSIRELQRNVNTLYDERLLSSQQPVTEIASPADAKNNELRSLIKDPYVLEFLPLPDHTVPQKETWKPPSSMISPGFSSKPTKGFHLSADNTSSARKPITFILIRCFTTTCQVLYVD